MRTTALLALLLSFQIIQVQAQDSIVHIQVKGGRLEGSLRFIKKQTAVPVVLIIAGSGPTDRNGNQMELENNSLKLIADTLQNNDIASLRYDKRGIGESKEAATSERQLRFEDYIEDVKSWIKFLSKDKHFSKIIVAGHSEGSLLGLIASENNKHVNAFISIAGAGRPADEILKEQFEKVPQDVKNILFPLIDRLKKGDSIANVPPMLYMLFRPSIQPYMTSWFKYDPAKEIQKLKVPILILQGKKDIQVKINDAELLSKAYPQAQLRLIENMNHVLKYCEFDNKEKQMDIYSNPSLPLHPELVSTILSFIRTIK